MFNGSRTSFEPSECIPFVAEVPRQSPKVEYAQYTKNHAWMPANIIPEMDPAEEISTVSLLVQLSTTTERRCGCLLQIVFITMWMPKMSFQMYEFELNTEVLFTNKDGRRSYVWLDI